MKAPKLISCVGVEHDLPLLPHFLAHYRSLGVRPEDMYLIANAADAAHPGFLEAECITGSFGAPPPRRWIAPYTSDTMWRERRALQRSVAGTDDWIISADVDELHEYPASLNAFLAYMDDGGFDCAQGVFIDRLAPDGELRAVAASPALWDQFPLRADVACTVRRGEPDSFWHGTVKLMVMRGYLFPKKGGHHADRLRHEMNHVYGAPLSCFPGMTRAPVRFSVPLRVHHFKWTAALKRAVVKRFETPGASPVGSRYGRRLIGYLGSEDRIAPTSVPIMRFDPLGFLPWRLRLAAFRLFAHKAVY